jgi:metallophosphoesterase (TIGR03767 family)
MSRRQFMATVGALGAVWGIAPGSLGRALAAPAAPGRGGTTLDRVIRMMPPATRQYRTLAFSPGEPYVARLDVLGREPDAARAGRRRSLVYLGHLTDMHVIDAQSPARLEPMAAQDHSLWGGAMRPQDTLTVHVAAAMVDAMSRARMSPLTGAPMSAAIVTGDSADMHSELELAWYIDALDGGEILANSGAVGVYEGVQAWSEASYAWHPEDPSLDPFGAYGFPSVPGLLTTAVSNPVSSVGLPVPWFTVFGNHDTTFMGTIGIDSHLRAMALGDRKAVTWEILAADYLGGLAADASLVQRLANAFTSYVGWQPDVRAVTPDPARKLFEQAEFMAAHFDSPAVPGPVGHGFTQANLDTGQTWWTADVGANVRLFGLDTCNQIAGPDGAVPEDQFEWLKAGLADAQAQGRLAIVVSHHNSLTLENEAVPAIGPTLRLIHAEEFLDMLLGFPAVIAWVNGHTHINTIQSHARGDGGGLWEITAASCVDFPQQQQLIEVVDNRDGTLSIFTTTLDHASDAVWTSGDLSQSGLASLSRELSANDWVETPAMRLGSPLDRNAELLLKAPFDLSVISDADLEKAHLQDTARLLAYAQARGESG